MVAFYCLLSDGVDESALEQRTEDKVTHLFSGVLSSVSSSLLIVFKVR